MQTTYPYDWVDFWAEKHGITLSHDAYQSLITELMSSWHRATKNDARLRDIGKELEKSQDELIELLNESTEPLLRAGYSEGLDRIQRIIIL